MTRPVRSQDLKLIDAVIQYVRECQAGMLGLSATPLELSPGGKPQVGNKRVEDIAQFTLCGHRVFWGKRREVFDRFYAILRDLDEMKAEQIVCSELGMDAETFDRQRQAIESDRDFAKELRAHQMFRRWMQEPQEPDFVSRNRGDANGMRTLSSADAIEIRAHHRRGCSVHQLSKYYGGVADSTISRIVRGESWR